MKSTFEISFLVKEDIIRQLLFQDLREFALSTPPLRGRGQKKDEDIVHALSKVREYMRKTVRSISGISVRILRSVTHSTRGPVVNMPMVYLLFFQK